MKAYQLVLPVEGIIFDMDNTLYTHEGYARHQEDVLVERLAAELAVGKSEAVERVRLSRSRLTHANGGKKPSLGTVFLDLGISIATSVVWRNTLIEPERYLKPDPKLRAVLEVLGNRHGLAIVTNNPVEIARRTLAAVGVDGLVPFIVGLDSTGVSKPDPAAFRIAAERLSCPFERVVSVGDRFEIDIEPALELGMAGLLVDGVEEVYALPNYLAKS
jgi:phosphoglycolate phosphatase/putative hydrolase of the HAD superfamily